MAKDLASVEREALVAKEHHRLASRKEARSEDEERSEVSKTPSVIQSLVESIRSRPSLPPRHLLEVSVLFLEKWYVL